MRLLLRRTVLVVIVLALAGTLAYAFMPRPVPVDAASADQGPLRVTVDQEGKTRIKERYVVSAPLAGRLQRLELKAGDSVVAGQTVTARIDPTEPELLDVRAQAEAQARVRAAEAAVQRAEALLAGAQAAQSFAEAERQRIEAALERQAANQRELHLARTLETRAQQELRAAEFGREIARFEHDQAQAALLRTQPGAPPVVGGGQAFFEIPAPITGKVLRLFQESSAVVAAGAPLLELGDPSNLEIVIDVLSTDAVQIPPGAPVLIEHWGGAAPLHGTVRLVEPAGFTKISALGVEEQRVNVIVDFAPMPEQEQRQRAALGDGFRVEGRIILWEQASVLKIPTSAMFRKGDGWAVFAIENGRAALRVVVVGRQGGAEAEVIDGMQLGQRIIVHPSDKISDGVRVTPR